MGLALKFRTSTRFRLVHWSLGLAISLSRFRLIHWSLRLAPSPSRFRLIHWSLGLALSLSRFRLIHWSLALALSPFVYQPRLAFPLNTTVLAFFTERNLATVKPHFLSAEFVNKVAMWCWEKWNNKATWCHGPENKVVACCHGPENKGATCVTVQRRGHSTENKEH